jgi:hypothetical protein
LDGIRAKEATDTVVNGCEKRELEGRKGQPTNLLEITVPINIPAKVGVSEWRGMGERRNAEKTSWIGVLK